MGRRSKFERIDKDKYNTIDPRAVPPLLPHLIGGTYIEPCAGKGCLMDQLTRHGLTCAYACDIAPEGFGIEHRDALTITQSDHMIITNPPWKREKMHKLIEHFLTLGVDVWLLFDASWAFSEQAVPYLKFCHKMIAMPRLQWFRNTEHSAQDDCAWYLFRPNEGATVFINERERKRKCAS